MSAFLHNQGDPSHFSNSSNSPNHNNLMEEAMEDSESDDDSQHSGAKRNVRPMHNIGQACKFCKKRHIRCDGNFPCTQCVKRNLQCTFGTKTKRGPKPKTDLYEHCNKLMVDLEVQKQIAEYWREQFMTAMKKHGKDGMDLADENGMQVPMFSAEIDRIAANNRSSNNSSGSNLNNPSGSPMQMDDSSGSMEQTSPPTTAGGPGSLSTSNSSSSIPSSNNNNALVASNSGPKTGSQLTSSTQADSSSNANQGLVLSSSTSSAVSSLTSTNNNIGTSAVQLFVPSITTRDPKPVLTRENILEMLALFTEHIQPIIPDYVFMYSPEVCLEAWNSTKAERDAMEDHSRLADMFEHCVIAAHGFRLTNQPEIMHRFAKKAEDLLQLLFFQRESQCQPELAQKLVQALICLSFYYRGDDRDGSKQSVIMLAYQIISMHRTFIAPATMHRVYYTMIHLSENQPDRVYWFNQASSLATQMKIQNPASTTAASMMFIFSSLHPKANFDQPSPSFTKQQLLAFLRKVDEARSIFSQSTTAEGAPMTREAITTFGVLMCGCKSELLLMLGDLNAARESAQWTIETGHSTQRPVHISLFGIQCAAEVAMALRLTPLLHLALNTFERHAPALPIANRFHRRISSQMAIQESLRDSHMHQTSLTGSLLTPNADLGLTGSNIDFSIVGGSGHNNNIALISMDDHYSGIASNSSSAIANSANPIMDVQFNSAHHSNPMRHSSLTANDLARSGQPLRMSQGAIDDIMMPDYDAFGHLPE